MCRSTNRRIDHQLQIQYRVPIHEGRNNPSREHVRARTCVYVCDCRSVRGSIIWSPYSRTCMCTHWYMHTRTNTHTHTNIRTASIASIFVDNGDHNFPGKGSSQTGLDREELDGDMFDVFSKADGSGVWLCVCMSVRTYVSTVRKYVRLWGLVYVCMYVRAYTHSLSLSSIVCVCVCVCLVWTPCRSTYSLFHPCDFSLCLSPFSWFCFSINVFVSFEFSIYVSLALYLCHFRSAPPRPLYQNPTSSSLSLSLSISRSLSPSVLLLAVCDSCLCLFASYLLISTQVADTGHQDFHPQVLSSYIYIYIYKYMNIFTWLYVHISI